MRVLADELELFPERPALAQRFAWAILEAELPAAQHAKVLELVNRAVGVRRAILSACEDGDVALEVVGGAVATWTIDRDGAARVVG